MSKKPRSVEASPLDIPEIATAQLTVVLVGLQPLIYHAMSAKGVDELLFPSGEKTKAEKMATLKHEPWREFRDSTYRYLDQNESRPTLLMFPCGAFKKAMADAAIDLPGVKKAQITRLLWIEDRDVPIWGVPEIYLTTVRNSDINHTPDIRSRAILRHWAARFTITYVRPNLHDRGVVTLLQNAGKICGIGDGRQQKGQGFGQFRIVAANDPQFLEIVNKGGRAAQEAALAHPACFDLETERALQVYTHKLEQSGDRFLERLPLAKRQLIEPVLAKPNGGKRAKAPLAVVAAAKKGMVRARRQLARRERDV